MKKALALIAAAALMAAAGTAMAAPKSIVDSKHNLSSYNPNNISRNVVNNNATQICIYCHTPHNANGNLPIWNRNDPSQKANFVLYSGVGMTNVSNKTFTNDSISLFCMSCHDGSALGTGMLYNVPNSLPSNENLTLSGIASTVKTNLYGYAETKQAGRSLKGTHPVNFAVDQTKNAANTTGAGGGGDLAAVAGTVGARYLQSANNANAKFPLYKSERSADQSFECSSCHAVHDDQYSPFLRDTMQNSQLCLGCHKK